MKKRVFIVHGWDGSPKSDWLPWLQKELQNRDFEVLVPKMPNPEEPKIETWVPYLANSVGEVDENTFFVGHSIGCQTILRFLEGLPKDKKVGGAVFVAGFSSTGKSTLKGLTEEEKEIIAPWLNAPINLEKVKPHLPKSVAIFSDNDLYVPLSNKDVFEEELGTKTIIEHAKGHFTDESHITQLPIALKSILEISN
ncbi:MAG: serine hydrolase family protein [Candidatus Levybacteria bacterium]|nr:serine hydrolase family protein [Candidatus Levybacteria bacterium]